MLSRGVLMEKLLSSNNYLNIEIKNSYSFLPISIGNILFFFMIFSPRTYQNIKIPLVLIIVGIILIGIVTSGNINLVRKVFIWFLILLVYGNIWSFIGVVNNNPGAIDSFRLSVIWVLIYMVFICGINSYKIFYSLIKTLTISSLIISAYNIITLLVVLEWWPDQLFIALDLGSRIGIHPGYIQFTAHNIGSLHFLVPFLISVYVLEEKERLFKVNNKLFFLTLILTIAIAFLSGRRSLLLVFFITPIVIVFFNGIAGNKTNTKKIIGKLMFIFIIIVIVVAIISFSLQWNFSAFIKNFFEAFNISSDNVRVSQYKALTDAFTHVPIFGSGFGKGVQEVVRSSKRPWNYELSYSLRLYNTGLLGIIIYIGCIAWIYITGFKIVKRNNIKDSLIISLLVGMTGFLIANATNPYFGSFDFMWVIFLPIAYINLKLQKIKI
jgi:hypothetical protein